MAQTIEVSSPAPTTTTKNISLWQRLYSWLDQHADRLLFALICLYILVFSMASFYKYETYQTGYDQIYFEQALWNTSEGRFMEQSDFAYSTSAFAVDWMPILTLFVPFYWLLPSPHTLFFVETLILGLGALPIFWLARDKFDSKPIGLLFAVIYFLNPTLEYFNLLPFNLRAPGLVCLLFAFYFFERGAGWRFGIFALLAIATRTEVSLVIAMFGVYGLLNWPRVKARLWLPPLVLAPIYFVIIFSLILPAFITPGIMVVPPAAQPIQISAEQREYIANTDTIISTTYGDLGKNLPDVLLNTVKDPLKTFQRVFTRDKLLYLALMLFPLAFLPLFAPRVLVFALPIVAINLLSIRSTQFDYRSHYSALLLFPLLVGAIYGTANLTTWLRSPKTRFVNVVAILGLLILFMLASQLMEYDPWLDVLRSVLLLLFLVISVIYGVVNLTIWLRSPKIRFANLATVLGVLIFFVLAAQLLERNPLLGVLRNAEVKAMVEPTNKLISRVPIDASVSSTSFLGPHLMPRRYSYLFPLALYSPPLEAVQYILIDTNAQALYLKENGKVFDGMRPIDWLRQTDDFKLVDKVEVTGQKDREGQSRQIQLWQRIGTDVPPYVK